MIYPGNYDITVLQNGTWREAFRATNAARPMTINAALSATKTAYQYAVATLLPIGTDAFILSGEVTAWAL